MLNIWFQHQISAVWRHQHRDTWQTHRCSAHIQSACLLPLCWLESEVHARCNMQETEQNIFSRMWRNKSFVITYWGGITSGAVCGSVSHPRTRWHADEGNQTSDLPITREQPPSRNTASLSVVASTRSGVWTHEGFCPLDLKSNALTTRPSWCFLTSSHLYLAHLAEAFVQSDLQ